MKVFLVVFVTSLLGSGYAENIVPSFEELQQMNGFQRDPSQDLESAVIDSDPNITPPKEKYDIEKLRKSIAGFIEDLDQTPTFRGKKHYIRPEVVNLETGHKAVKVELTSDSLMEAVKNILTSPKFRLYADLLARKAAVFYRSVKDEMAKDKRQKKRFD